MAEAGFRPGLWEIAVRTELVGVPANKAMPVTETHCLKDESQVPQILQKDRSCRVIAATVSARRSASSQVG